MLILFNATASFYERCSFFFLMRQPLFTNTILFSLMRQPLFTNTVLLLFFFPAQRTGSSQIFSVRSDPGMIGRRIPASAVTEMLPVR